MNITTGKMKKAQKIVLYGTEGIGKSTFASKFPNPLFSDTEGSTTHLDVARFDKPTSWPMLMAQAEFVRINKPCATYVIDTADWAEALAKDYVIAQDGSGKIKSIEDYGYGKGYTMLAEEFGRFLNKLSEVVNAGINVVVLAHSTIKKFEQPDELGAYDRYELKLEKKVSPLVKEWGDVVLFANYKTVVVNVDNQGAAKGKNKAQGGSRVMYTTHNPAWDAKNRWGLKDELPLDFNFISAHVPNMSDMPNQDEVEKVEEETLHTQNEDVITGNEEVHNEAPTVSIHGPLGDLMRQANISDDELMNYVINVAEHFPEGTSISALPKEYTDGALVSNWSKVETAIKVTYNSNPETF